MVEILKFPELSTLPNPRFGHFLQPPLFASTRLECDIGVWKFAAAII